jgi:DNA-binding transcriptional ArsR family regulator
MSSSARRRLADEHRLDLLFSALAARTRREMLSDLAAGPTTVTELAEPHAMSLPAVSRHLKVLETAGLVQRVVEGRVHRVAINGQAFEDVQQWLAEHRAFWEGQLAALADFAGAADSRARAGKRR